MLYFINPASRKRRARKRVTVSRSIPKVLRRQLRKRAAKAGERWYGVNPSLDTGPVLVRESSHRPARRSRAQASGKHKGGKAMAGRRRRRNARGQFVKGGTARRRRRRARATARRTTRRVTRRRRRRAVVALAAPRRRARRRRTYRSNPGHRRRYRRNPSARGIVGGVVQGLKDGGAIVLGQVAARKVRGALQGVVAKTPLGAQVSSGPGSVALTIASALIVAAAARKFAPAAYARTIAAGAFAEAVNGIIAQTPIAPYLSAFPVRRVSPLLPRGVSAWPRSGYNVPAGLAAWPRVGMAQQVGN